MEAIPVLLTLSGSAHGGAVEEEERVDLMTTGLLYPLKEGWKLTYTETQPDDDATSDITLLIGKGRVLMSRSGDYGTTMVFRKDHRFEGAYQTPYGALSMAVFTTRADVSMAEDHGSVTLEYQLDLQGSFAAMHELRLTYAANTEQVSCS